MNHTWYYLDPDNTKEEPKGPHCERCMKPLNAHAESYTAIVMHPVNPWFRIANGHEAIPKHLYGLIGSDCLAYVIKTYGEQVEQ